MALGSAVNVNGCQRDSHGQKQSEKISESDGERNRPGRFRPRSSEIATSLAKAS